MEEILIDMDGELVGRLPARFQILSSLEIIGRKVEALQSGKSPNQRKNEKIRKQKEQQLRGS